MTDRYIKITTYKQAFEQVLGMEFDKKVQDFVKRLEEEGHTEKSIAFSIWKTQEKLMRFKDDSRFLGILKNEILKYSWRKNDPRWDAYWEKKKEEQQAKKYQEALQFKYKQNKIDGEDRKIEKNLEKQIKTQKYPKSIKGYVYFVQGINGGAIKIGYSDNPETRLKALQTGYPDILKILLLVPGTEKTERYFHNKFAEYRLNGEWFRPEQDILKEISKFKASQQVGD